MAMALLGGFAPVHAQDTDNVRYELTFTGLFTADALMDDTTLPTGAHFSLMVGARQSWNSRGLWYDGGNASAGLEALAEEGSLEEIRAEFISSSTHSGPFYLGTGTIGATETRSHIFWMTKEHRTATAAAMIAPSPDWFVGTNGTDLRTNSNTRWATSVTVDLYPQDAGTEDGTEFSTTNAATDPQGTISSLRNTGKFSDNPIARLTFTLQKPRNVNNVSVTEGDGQLAVTWKQRVDAGAYKVQWKSGSQGWGDAASQGRQAIVTGSANTSYTITGLENGTEYTVRVFGTNRAGDSQAPPRNHATGTPTAPANIAPTFDDGESTTRSFAETIGDGTVQTAANIGAAVSASDDDTDDTLEYALGGTDASKFGIDTSTGQLKTKVGETYDYESDTSHEVTVTVSDGNSGTDAITVTINVTDEDEVPLVPAAPTLSAVSGSDTKLSVSWTTPDNTGRPAIASYDLQYKATFETTWTGGPEDETGTSAEITDLAPGTTYEVQVRASNSDGDGDWSSAGSGTTTRPANSAATGQPSITGTAAEGYTIDSNTSGVADTNGKTRVDGSVTGYAWSYQWIRVDGSTETNIAGATSATYTLTGDDVGKTVKVKVSFKDDHGYDEEVTSAAYPSSGTVLAASTEVTLTVDPIAVDESSGTTSVTVTATLNGPPIGGGEPTLITFLREAMADEEGIVESALPELDRLSFVIVPRQTSGTTTFDLTLADDDIDESDEVLLITPVASVNGLTNHGTQITITDDDTRGVTISATTLTVAEGASETYTVVLDSEPTADVTVTVSGAASTDLAVTPSSLTFTDSDWSTAQTVTVAADEDADADNDEVTLTHAVSGGDYGSNSVTAASVDVTVDDDEVAPPVWSTTMTVGDGAAGGTGYDASSDAQITGDALADDDFVVGPSTVTVERLYVGPHKTFSSSVGLVFEVNLSLANPTNYTLEFAGETLPLSSATAYSHNERFVFTPEWLAANAPSLDEDNFRVTVPPDGTVGACLRTASQTCPDTGPPPALSTATVDGTSLVLTYSQTLNTTAPATSAYTVDVAGSEVTPSSVAISGTTVTLTLSTAVTSGQTVTISYTVPSSNPVQNAVGFHAGRLSNQGVRNNTGGFTNTAPTAANNTVTTDEDVAYTFAARDFSFAVVELDDALASVKITTLETAGDLKLDGTDVVLNQVITKADIDADKLIFTSPLNAHGKPYTTFQFKVSDGTDESAAAYTMTIDVDGQHDAPTAANNTVTTREDVAYTFAVGDFNFADVDGHLLASVKITTLETGGDLQLDGTDVTLDQVITKADINANKLIFTPASGETGDPYTTFQFTVNDGILESAAAYTMTIDVTANTAPTAANNTVTTDEDVAYTFEAGDFNFSDTDGDALASVKITTLETEGDLELDGTDVALNQVITKADIDADKLIFTPDSGASGTGYATFGFKVNDGTDESAAAYTMTIDVTEEPPVWSTTMTVGDGAAGGTGYDVNAGAEVTGGALADDDFTVERLYVGPHKTFIPTVGLVFETNLSLANYATYTLEIAGETLPLSSANASTFNQRFTFTLEWLAANAPSLDNDNFRVTVPPDGTVGACLRTASQTCPDTGPPPALSTATVDGTSLVLTYSQTLNTTAPATSAYTVDVAGSEVTPSSVAISGTTVTLTLSTAVTSGQTVTVSYTVPSSNPVQNAAGFHAGRLVNQAVTNNTVATNTAPTAPDNTVTTIEDVAYTFAAEEFNFADDDAGDALASVKITTLETDGDLELDGTDVALNQVITKTDIDEGKLVFTPDSGASGTGYATFGFKVSDGTDESAAAYTMTVDVTSTAVTLSVNPASVAESASATTVTVTGTLNGVALAADTAVTVTVGAAGDAATEGTDYATVDDVTLTITAGQTSGTATFSLDPTDDDVDEGNETLSVGGTVTGLTVTSTTIEITDDDTRGVTISKASLTVAEGGNGTYTVVLDSEPTADVTVSVSGMASTDLTVTPTSLTFTDSDWETAQTVTVAAAQDADADDDEVTLTHTVAGDDGEPDDWDAVHQRGHGDPDPGHGGGARRHGCEGQLYQADLGQQQPAGRRQRQRGGELHRPVGLQQHRQRRCHGQANHFRHGAGGPDADGGHRRHRRHRRAANDHFPDGLHIPVGPSVERNRHRHRQRNLENLHTGIGRCGQKGQSEGLLHRWREL